MARFGPYITDGSKNAKIPKEVDPKKIKLGGMSKDFGPKRRRKNGVVEVQNQGAIKPSHLRASDHGGFI